MIQFWQQDGPAGKTRHCVGFLWTTHLDLALVSPGALLVGDVERVRLAPDVAHVHAHAASQAHAPVERALHDDGLVALALGDEPLSLAVFLHACNHTQKRDPPVLFAIQRK